MTDGILYSFRRCPYAIRARWAILICGKRIILREVSLKNKPKELIKASPKATVPVLITSDGNIIDESLDIINWALAKVDLIKRKSLQGSTNKLDINKLIEENDNHFKFHLDRYKYPNRYKDIDQNEHRKKAEIILIGWEQRLASSYKNYGERWLSNGMETIADWCLWPFVRQFRAIESDSFDKNKNFINIKKWLHYYTNHKLYSLLMAKNKPWEPKAKEIII